MKRRVRSLVLVACATSITAVAVAAPVRWSANGHYYRAVRVGTPISWDAANQAAQALGPGWHLATITSAEEDEFVKGLLGSPFSSTVRIALLRDEKHLARRRPRGGTAIPGAAEQGVPKRLSVEYELSGWLSREGT